MRRRAARPRLWTACKWRLNIVVRAFLTDLVAGANRPVLIFFDEADCLGAETLIFFLRQLRDGYLNRGRIALSLIHI